MSGAISAWSVAAAEARFGDRADRARTRLERTGGPGVVMAGSSLRGFGRDRAREPSRPRETDPR